MDSATRITTLFVNSSTAAPLMNKLKRFRIFLNFSKIMERTALHTVLDYENTVSALLFRKEKPCTEQ